MTRVLLHIGDHKTGTSSLQRLCAAGHLPAGVLYPMAGRANGAGHHNLAWSIGADPRFSNGKGGWTQVWEEVRAQLPQTVLISSEAFEFKRPKPVHKALFSKLPHSVEQVEIALYIRPHAPRLLASYAERLKRGIGPFERAEFLNHAIGTRRFHFADRVRRWQKTFGREALKIRVFQPELLYRGDMVDDFFLHFLRSEPPQVRCAKANQSPCANALKIMQEQGQIHFANGGARGARANAALIRAKASAAIPGSRPVWTEGEAAQLVRAFQADALELDDILSCNSFSQSLATTIRATAQPLERDVAQVV
ncbi:MAG: hypothetical protein ACPGSI_08545 [Pikeienuella sp.]